MTAGREMISPRTRTAFRETLVKFSNRKIRDIFRNAGFSSKIDYIEWQERHKLVEDYYATADFSSRDDVRMTLAAYAEVLDGLEPETAQQLLQHLKRDGIVRDSDGRFTLIPGKHNPLLGTLAELAETLHYPRLAEQVDLLVDAAESNPALAVGIAKETIETVCKSILEARGVQPGKPDLGKLVRDTAKELELLPDSIPNNAKGAGTIKRLLSNLTQVSQGMAELRNLYGTGHGRGARDQSVRPRHARLAVNAAATLVTFLLETHLATKSKDVRRTAENAR